MQNNETKEIGLYLFIPGYSEDNHELGQIGYLLLDEALGEYDVETKLAMINMLPPEADTQGDRYALEELPKYFDALYADIHGG